MAEGKVAIAIGSLSFSGEGEQTWVTEQFDKILAKVPELLKQAPNLVSPSSGSANGGGQQSRQSAGIAKGTVAAIAAKLGVATGPELIMAAAAKLTFVDGKDSFSRKSLLEAMKTATNYYKQTYSNNLSKYLKTVQQDQRLTEHAADQFALTAAEKTKLESLVA